jgi:hypothetical protein
MIISIGDKFKFKGSTYKLIELRSKHEKPFLATCVECPHQLYAFTWEQFKQFTL